MEKTFIELNRVNRSNETKVVLLDLTKVVLVTGIHTEGKTQNLYDCEGEFIEEKVIEEPPVRYRVIVADTTSEIIIDQENYDILKKALLK